MSEYADIGEERTIEVLALENVAAKYTAEASARRENIYALIGGSLISLTTAIAGELLTRRWGLTEDLFVLGSLASYSGALRQRRKELLALGYAHEAWDQAAHRFIEE